MREKTAAILCLGLVSALLTPGCVSPFYGTARIKKGGHADAGIALNTHLMPSIDSWMYFPSFGVRGDVEVRYGVNEYLGFHTRGALGITMIFPQLFLDGAIGLQAALPMKSMTLALRTELSYYGGGLTVSPGLLVGIGREEKVTVGGRIHIFGNAYDRKNPHPEYGIRIENTPTDFFICAHLSPKLSLFAGSQLFLTSNPYQEFIPIAALGVGYNIK